MKKRLFALLLAVCMILSMTACGEKKDNAAPEAQDKEESLSNRPASQYDNSTLEGILTGIETDFADSIKFLQDSFEDLNASVGETYEEYKENKKLLTEWYALILSEETALMERTKERAVEYLKLISSSIDHKDDDAMDDAMDDYYDRIYDGAMDDFYDEIYDNLMEDAYDTYYDGIVGDGYELEPYDKWSDESSAAYKEWSDTSSNIYKGWSDTSSILYRYWSSVSSGFYQNNFDVDAIIEECKKKMADEEAEAAQEAKKEEAAKEGNSEDIRPEFKEAMDNYEAFFDEYVEFMNEYSSADADDMLAMMEDYTEYMKQYVETLEAFEKLESSDMSADEAIYYAEVSTRIYAKMLEIE